MRGNLTLQEALLTPEVRSFLREIIREELGASTTRTLRETPEEDSGLREFIKRRGMSLSSFGMADPDAA
jgi:hypothetical protein